MLNDTVFQAEESEKPSSGPSFPIWKTITTTKCEKNKVKPCKQSVDYITECAQKL